MPLETAGFVNQLDADNPLPTDQKAQGDDHLRLIKAVLLATFPQFDAALLKTPAFLNSLGGSKMGAWPESSMRLVPNGTSLNSITDSGWWYFDNSNPNSPFEYGFLLILSSGGDLATPQNGRWVFQIAFTRWPDGGSQNAQANIGGISVRANFNGAGWLTWVPDFKDPDPVGTTEIFFTTSFSLARGTLVTNPLRLNGMGTPVSGGFSAAAGVWYVLGGTGYSVDVFPGPTTYYQYMARRVR